MSASIHWMHQYVWHAVTLCGLGQHHHMRTTKLTRSMVCCSFLHRRPTRCVDISETPSPSPSPKLNPSPINQIGDSVSLAVVATAVAVPLGLTLLIVSVALLVVLVYIGLLKRRMSSKTGGDIERSAGATVTVNANVNGEAEPYGQSSCEN